MPTVTRRRSLGVPPEEVWGVVSDPDRLPEWWPGVTRVEDATPHGWTTVLTSPRGKAVRVDYTRVEFRPQRRLVWRQEIEESPFERILSESTAELELAPGAAGGTEVSLTMRHRPRGFARFGFIQLRAAASKQARDALDGLAGVVEA